MPTISAIAQQIVDGLLSSLSAFAQGLGSGIQDCVTAMFFVTTGTGADAVTTLSPYAILTLVFGGIALAVGLTRSIYRLGEYKLGKIGKGLKLDNTEIIYQIA